MIARRVSSSLELQVIPVLASGTKRRSVPDFLADRIIIDVSNPNTFEDEFRGLVREILHLKNYGEASDWKQGIGHPRYLKSVRMQLETQNLVLPSGQGA